MSKNQLFFVEIETIEQRSYYKSNEIKVKDSNQINLNRIKYNQCKWTNFRYKNVKRKCVIYTINQYID